ncbi:MAG: sulfatase/phosphatase domain-containing protein [Planctomycetota bacterium]
MTRRPHFLLVALVAFCTLVSSTEAKRGRSVLLMISDNQNFDEIELYDLQEDPDEVVNLADEPKHADVRRTLSEKLVAFLERTGDPWLLRHELPRGK